MSNTKAFSPIEGWIEFKNNSFNISVKIESIETFLYNHDKGTLSVYTDKECFEFRDDFGLCYNFVSIKVKGNKKI